MTGLSGGCLCRSVRFSVTGPIIRTGHCHCESCRRATSSPVTSFFCVARADASFEGEALRHYASSPGVRRGFCGNCGSPMSYETAERPAEIDLYRIDGLATAEDRDYDIVRKTAQLLSLNLEEELKPK